MSESKSDPLEPAFPRNYTTVGHNGMTRRDWFAGQALIGMNASPALFEAVTSAEAGAGAHYDRLARHAYWQADAMLAERAKAEG